jgi:ribosomal protein S18 acetylase RimI-like enzyme
MAAEPEKLKREAAGRYVTADGRFSIEQSSGRWVAIDAETTDDLGLPLVRGPFDTLDEAKTAIAAARTGPKATSSLADRLKAAPTRGRSRQGEAGATSSRTPKATAREAPKPREPQIDLRDFTLADGDALRQLWKAAGFGSAGDDDRSLAAFAERNPGLLVVATADGEVIGSALGGWDGRRGWIYHVAVAVAFRRKGIATRLVRRVEQRLRVAGAAKINTIVPDDHRPAKAFWASLGYELTPTSQYAREI